MTMAEPVHSSRNLSVSLVTFRPDMGLLHETITSLGRAVTNAQQHSVVRLADVNLTIVDNNHTPDPALQTWLTELEPSFPFTIEYVSGHGNVGYGCGHNYAIHQSKAAYHLVLNPDISMKEDSLSLALAFMEQHKDFALLAPRVNNSSGEMQYLCRRFPSVLVLFLRGFAPAALQHRFKNRLAKYEMRESINDKNAVFDLPIVSGCFMFFRGHILRQLKGFDPRYFLYFEDYDLCLRTATLGRIAYVPEVIVQHYGGGAARKGLTHIRYFITSAVRFFNRFGWQFF